MIVVVQFSGGKDSLASLLWAINTYGLSNVICVFCDTQWEHELTYQHIMEVIEKTKVNYVKLTGKYSFFLLAKRKKRFPSTMGRFCTEKLKIEPFIDWVLETKQNMIVVQGIRTDESNKRSKMEKECTFFKYYFQPYGDKKGKPKKMSYRGKAVREHCKEYATDIIRPFFNATANDVMTYIKSNGFKPNPLYYMGFKRVGCFPCIMCNKSEMQLMIEKFPQYLERIDQMEQEIKSTFFPPDYIPEYAQEMFDSSNGKQRLPGIKSVIKYLKGKRGTMFDETEETKSCMSIYNICE